MPGIQTKVVHRLKGFKKGESMVRTLFIGLFTAIPTGLFAQTVSLNGKVSDGTGKAIVGAIVSLKSQQLADTTDATGNYTLTGNPVSLNGAMSFPGKGKVMLTNGMMDVELGNSQKVRADLYDLQGNLIAKVLDKSLPAGNHRFDAKKHAPGSAISLLRVSVGSQSAQFLYSPVQGESAPVAARSTSGALAKASADVLDVTAVGFKAKSVTLTSLQGKMDVTLESEFTGTCTESKPVNTTVRGRGTHTVVVETNTDEGIKEGTIYRPSDLAPGKKYPILVWGEGACAKNGLDNSASMAEIASYGYFVVADGTPNGTGSRPMNANNLDEMGKPVLAYINWAIAENRKPCSKYYQSLDTSKIAANGFSCGGLLSMGTAKDPRMTTWGLTSSGSFNNNPTLWNASHTPVIIIEGHQDNTGAYTNGLRDFNGLAPLGKPVYFISNKSMGHGGDLWSSYGGEFTKIHLAWLNWWLKGDTGATGKGVLVGSTCTYCTNSNWEVKSANIP